MAIMRIACAAAALLYIAPHLGADIIKTARPLFPSISTQSVASDALAEAALAYCGKNPEACLKFARAALGPAHADRETEQGRTSLAHAALRPALQDDAPVKEVPLPPARPPALRPALK